MSSKWWIHITYIVEQLLCCWERFGPPPPASTLAVAVTFNVTEQFVVSRSFSMIFLQVEQIQMYNCGSEPFLSVDVKSGAVWHIYKLRLDYSINPSTWRHTIFRGVRFMANNTSTSFADVYNEIFMDLVDAKIRVTIRSFGSDWQRSCVCAQSRVIIQVEIHVRIIAGRRRVSPEHFMNFIKYLNTDVKFSPLLSQTATHFYVWRVVRMWMASICESFTRRSFGTLTTTLKGTWLGHGLISWCAKDTSGRKESNVLG